jgi:hypothetical protein
MIVDVGTEQEGVRIFDFAIAKIPLREGEVEAALTMQIRAPVAGPSHCAGSRSEAVSNWDNSTYLLLELLPDTNR